MNIDTPTSTAPSALEPTTGCIAAAMEIIGGKWTALVVRDLASGPKRFCEFEKSIDDINPRTLSKRLDYLESAGIIRREHFSEPVPCVAYVLTNKGKDLLPILQQMARWGEKYMASNSRA